MPPPPKIGTTPILKKIWGLSLFKIMSKSKKIILILFIITTITLIYTIPNILIPLAKDKIHDYLEKSLNTRIILDRVGINLFTFSIILNNLTIENPSQIYKGPLLQANQILIKPSILPLLKKKLFINRITIDKPCLAFHVLPTGETNWDFFWQKGYAQSNNRILAEELLIKDGIFLYNQEFNPQKAATAEFHGIFIHLKNYNSSISYIEDIPLSTRIKGRGCLLTEPKGIVTFSGNANLTEKQISFLGNVEMNDISLVYFNNFYPEDSQIQVIKGDFSLISQVQCLHDQLQARPDVTVRNLQLKLAQDYASGDIFELPVVLVVDFFDIYKEELKFTFEVSGTLTDPEFHLEKVVAEKVSEVIGESIVRTIVTSPTIIDKLGERLLTITDKLKKFGLDIRKGTGKAIKKLGKPVEELIQGLKGK